MFEFGTIIADKYCLEEEIGEGGFASIWRANQMELDRPVALKLVRRRPGRRQITAEQVVKEARVAAAVRHRNVVSILDVGIGPDNTPYLVMEYLEGETLGERLDRAPMRIRDLVKAANGALRGLAAVHAAGIVHQDVKPDNIFLVYDVDGWFPKLVDFGISKTDPERTADGSHAVITGEKIFGTPAYMSPEQARGFKHIDGRSDLFSLGIVLYEAFTGLLPFDDDDPVGVLQAIVRKEPARLDAVRPGLGSALADFLEKALAKDPDDRFQSAREMRQALHRAVGTITVENETGQRQPHRVSTSTQMRPMSMPPAGSTDPADALGGTRQPIATTTDEGPVRGETVLVDRAEPKDPPRRSVALIGGAAVAAAAVLSVAAYLALRDPPAPDGASGPRTESATPVNVAPSEPPRGTIEPPLPPPPETEDEPAPETEPGAASSQDPGPDPDVEPDDAPDPPPAVSEAEEAPATPPRRRRRRRTSRRRRVFATPDF